MLGCGVPQRAVQRVYERYVFQPLVVHALLQPIRAELMSSPLAIVQPLQSPSMWYLGRLVQDDCACNTVRYSLVEACERCQFSLDKVLHVLPSVVPRPTREF